MFFLKISWIKEGRTKRSRKRGPVERVLCLAIGSRLSAHRQLASPVANAGRLYEVQLDGSTVHSFSPYEKSTTFTFSLHTSLLMYPFIKVHLHRKSIYAYFAINADAVHPQMHQKTL